MAQESKQNKSIRPDNKIASPIIPLFNLPSLTLTPFVALCRPTSVRFLFNDTFFFKHDLVLKYEQDNVFRYANELYSNTIRYLMWIDKVHTIWPRWNGIIYIITKNSKHKNRNTYIRNKRINNKTKKNV